MVRAGRSARVLALLAVGVMLAAAVPSIAGAPAAARSTRPCEVRNETTDVAFGTLAGAVAVAGPGDRITVLGVCHGTTAIDRDLSIVGLRPGRSRRPILDGDAAGSVIVVAPGVTVTLTRLMITDGIAADGGGIHSEGSLTLDRVRVRRNQAERGGGIFLGAGSLTMVGSTTVRRNSAGTGGGLYIAGGELIEIGRAHV